MFNSYYFNHDLVSTTYPELQSKKNIPDLIEKISWLCNSEILHKAPPRLITKATETPLTGPKKPNNKSEICGNTQVRSWKHDNMDNIATGDFDLLYSVFLTINLFKTTIDKLR